MYITTVERNMALNRKLGMPHSTQTPPGGIKRGWRALLIHLSWTSLTAKKWPQDI